MSDSEVRLAKYVLMFWGACIVAGVALGVGLAAVGMEPQDAVNSGLVVVFMPALVAVALCFLLA